MTIKALERQHREISDEHRQRIRDAARQLRLDPNNLIDIKLSENSKDKSYFMSLDKALLDFFVQLNVIIIWRAKSGDFDISINRAYKDFQYRYGRPIGDKYSDVILFLTQYIKNVQSVNAAQPYPTTASLMETNGWARYEALNELRTEAIKSIKDILGVKNGSQPCVSE